VTDHKQPSLPVRLGRLCDLLERTPALGYLLIVLLYLPWALQASRTLPLWHDELFTYWIAQTPNLSTLFQDLHTLDLNPPLVYLLTRLSFHLFGVSTLATRLPEILGFLLALLALFRFVRLRLGTSFALFAAALLLISDSASFAFEARPYALLLGFLALAMTAWQSAVRPHSRTSNRLPALAILFLAVLGMLLSHIFSVLAVAVLLLAELDRQRRNRALDPPLLVTLGLPLVAVLTYLPMLRNHGASLFPVDFQPTFESIAEFFLESISRPLLALLFTALGCLAVFRLKHLAPGPPAQGARWSFTQPEWTFIAGLFLAPLALMFELMRTHGAFFPRYAAIETFGVVLLTVALLARWTMTGSGTPQARPDPRAALLGFLLIVLVSGLWIVLPKQLAAHTLIPTTANSEPPLKPCQACALTAAADPSIPLVDASGLTFVEMNHREAPATLTRLFYLTDPTASAHFAHANIFENEAAVVQGFHLAGHVQPYSAFIAQHPRFFVLGTYDYPEDWLLRKLAADHATLRLVAHPADNYRDKELYEVQIAPDTHAASR
jgi:uncharacterized membrane protein